MGVTVAEVSAVLSARDEMSAAVTAARQRVQDLNDVIADHGPSLAFQKALDEARAKLEALGPQLSATASATSNLTSKMGEVAAAAPTKEFQQWVSEMQSARAAAADIGPAMGAATSATSALASEVGNASSKGNDFIGMADRIIERMAIYASARAVIGAIEGTIEWGVELERLSAQTGLTIEAIQELNYAAIQTAVPLDRITGAITQMQRKMEVEDGGFIAALGRLHVNFEELRAQAPEQQFDTLTAAISKVKDQTEFAGDAAQLFNSRSGASIAAVIKDWQTLKGQAEDANVVLGTNQVKALADVEKAWERAKLKAESYFATILAGPVRQAEQEGVGSVATSAARHIGVGLLNSMGPGLGDAVDTGIDYVSAMFGGSNTPSAPGAPGVKLPKQAAKGPDIDQRPKMLLALEAAEKVLTDEVKDRIEQEKQEADILHKIADIEAGRMSSAEALLKVTSNMKAELEASQKAMKELATESAAEEGARQRNLSRFGLGVDAKGNTVSQEMLNDPTFQRDQKLSALKSQPSTPAGTANREQEIINQWLDEINSQNTVIVGMTSAEREAADAATKLAAAHDAQKIAIDTANAALMKFSGLSFPTTPSDYSNISQTTLGGAFTNTNPALNAGRAPITPDRGTTVYHVEMHVNGVWDPATTAQMSDMVSQHIMSQTRQGRQLPAGS